MLPVQPLECVAERGLLSLELFPALDRTIWKETPASLCGRGEVGVAFFGVEFSATNKDTN